MASLRVSFLLCCVVPAALASDVTGVRNFHEVNERIYRGAQPNSTGFQNLAKMGVAVVVDLREAGARSEQEQRLVTAAGMKYVNVPMHGFGAPSPGELAKVLALLENESAGTIFVHCRRGADRTGTVLAVYRIRHDGWENRKALQEARSLGMSWMERGMQSYILHYETAPPAADATVAGQ
jgi:protein tyrosine/serine phosphatase